MLALVLRSASLVRADYAVLSDLDWRVSRAQCWVVLGPNGAGKSSLLSLCGAKTLPTGGDVDVLGQRLGETDLQSLRQRIAHVGPGLGRSFDERCTVEDVVLTGRHAALAPWWHDYGATDRDAARELLTLYGLGHRVRERFANLSEGERQSVLLARARISAPELVLLDEPFLGLDLGARERVIRQVEQITASDVPVVLVTHHVEEIPRTATHVALLRGGEWVATGPLDETLTSAALSETFRIAVEVRRTGSRWAARAAS